MSAGWIKIYRSITESCTRRGYGAETLGVMVWLLLNAKYEPTFHPKFGAIKPGEMVIKKPVLSREMGITESRLRAILMRLERDGFIIVDGCVKSGTKIGIVNYSQYQDTQDKPQKQPLTESTTCDNNSPITNRKTTDKPAILKEEINKERKEEIIYKEEKERKATEVLHSQNTPRHASEITFDYDNRCEFGGDGLEEAKRVWSESYPGLDIEGQLQQARAWLFANSAPAKRKRNIKAFLCRWMAKAQEIKDRRDGWRGASDSVKTASQRQRDWANGRFSGDYSEVRDDPEFSKL